MRYTVIGSILGSTWIILESIKVEDVESTLAPWDLPSIQIGLESFQTRYEGFVLVTKKKNFGSRYSTILF